MKQAEILARVLKGELLQCGEYLMTRAETISYKSKTDGKAASFDKLTHTILTSEGAVSVDEDTRKLLAFDSKTYKSPYVKGGKVVILVESKISVRGVVTIRGHLEQVEG